MIGLLALVLSTSSCFQLDKQRGAKGARTSSSAAMGSLGDVFRTQVHPYFRRNCASCHGVSQAPMFAASNVDEAYGVAKPLASFADPSTSVFMRKVRDSHCGSACSTDGKELLELLKAWANAEKKGGGGAVVASSGNIQTQALVIPADITDYSGTSYTTMRFKMDANTPHDPALDGVLFIVEIQQLSPRTTSSPGTYRIRRPQIATSQSGVRVQSVRVILNGKVDPNANDYVDIDSVVPPASFTPPSTSNPVNLPFPYLSPNNLLIIQEQATGDKIQIGFDRLETSAVTGCKNIEGFRTLVWPGMKANCMTCHGSSSDAAFARFRMVADSTLESGGGDAQENCLRSLVRTTLNAPDQSYLVRKPGAHLDGHPDVPGWAPLSKPWIQWIQSER